MNCTHTCQGDGAKTARLFLRIGRRTKAAMAEHASLCGESLTEFLSRAAAETRARDVVRMRDRAVREALAGEVWINSTEEM